MPIIRVRAWLFTWACVASGCAPAVTSSADGAAGNRSTHAQSAGQAAVLAGSASTPTASAGALGGRRSEDGPKLGAAGITGTSGTLGAAGAAGAMPAGQAAGSAGDSPRPDGSLFPIKPGNSWSFRTTKGSAVGNKTQTVGALEKVGGTGPQSNVMAYKLVTTKDDGMDKTESWQAELGGKIVRYRELAYSASTGQVELEEHWDPYKLRVDGTQQTAGATYTEAYSETKIMTGAAPMTATSTDTWKVVSLNESVTVPAGTFSAVVIEKVGGTSTKRYWFVHGVGKVKEQSGSQLEELTSYMVKP